MPTPSRPTQNQGVLHPRSGYRRPPPPKLRTLDERDLALPNAQLYFKIHRDPMSGQGQVSLAWHVAEGERRRQTITADHSNSSTGLEAWAYLMALQVLDSSMNVTVYTSSEHVPNWYTGQFERFQTDIKTTMAQADRIIQQCDLRIVGFEKVK